MTDFHTQTAYCIFGVLQKGSRPTCVCGTSWRPTKTVIDLITYTANTFIPPAVSLFCSNIQPDALFSQVDTPDFSLPPFFSPYLKTAPQKKKTKQKISVQMMEACSLGIGTVLRLERGACPLAKKVRQVTNEHLPACSSASRGQPQPPPLTPPSATLTPPGNGVLAHFRGVQGEV